MLRSFNYANLLTVATVLLVNVAAAEEITFVRSPDTGVDFTLQRVGDHYVAHFLVGVKDFKGQKFFVRVRTTYDKEEYNLDDVEDMRNKQIVNGIELKTKSDNDVWSINLPVPRFDSPARRKTAEYLIEMGPTLVGADETEFSWTIKEADDGTEKMITHKGEDHVGVYTLVYKVEGKEGKKEQRFETKTFQVKSPAEGLSCRLVDNRHLESGDQTAELRSPGDLGK